MTEDGPARRLFAGWTLPLGTTLFAVGILLGRQALSWYGLAAAAVCAALAAVAARGRFRQAICIAAFICAGSLMGYLAYHPALPSLGTQAVTGVVAQEIERRADGQVKTILRDVTIDGEKLRDGAFWSYYQDAEEPLPEGLTPGARIAMTAEVYAPQGMTNPDGFDFREYLLQRGVTVGVYGQEDFRVLPSGFSLMGRAAALRHFLSERLMAAMGEDAGRLASAMLLGMEALVEDADQEAFRRLGVAHLLVVSGFHVGVLATCLGLICSGCGKRARWILLTVLLLCYALLTGLNAPVVRAALLLLLAEYGHLRCRQVIPLFMLCASAMIQMAFSPALLTGASFQLTYGAVAGITLVYPRLVRRWKPESKALRRGWNALCVTLAAQLGVLWPELYWFGKLPLLSLPANLLITALASVLMLLDWLVLLTVMLPFGAVGRVVGYLPSRLTELLLQGVQAVGSQPGLMFWTRQADAPFLIGWALLLFSLSQLWPGRKRSRRGAALVGTLLVATILVPLPHPETAYIQFSVGNADAALLWDRDATVVIDTGEDGKALTAYLHKHRLSVDALVLTHLHMDHTGGVAELLAQEIPVKTCYVPLGAETEDVSEEALALLGRLEAAGTELRVMTAGDCIPLPSGQLTALWPQETLPRDASANSRSLALYGEINGTTMLLTGDLSGAYERYAARPADILKAAHHGSVGSTGEAFLATVDPQALLVSCNDARRAESIRKRAGNRTVYVTRDGGALTVLFEPDGRFSITPFLPEAAK